MSESGKKCDVIIIENYDKLDRWEILKLKAIIANLKDELFSFGLLFTSNLSDSVNNLQFHLVFEPTRKLENGKPRNWENFTCKSLQIKLEEAQSLNLIPILPSLNSIEAPNEHFYQIFNTQPFMKVIETFKDKPDIESFTLPCNISVQLLSSHIDCSKYDGWPNFCGLHFDFVYALMLSAENLPQPHQHVLYQNMLLVMELCLSIYKDEFLILMLLRFPTVGEHKLDILMEAWKIHQGKLKDSGRRHTWEYINLSILLALELQRYEKYSMADLIFFECTIILHQMNIQNCVWKEKLLPVLYEFGEKYACHYRQQKQDDQEDSSIIDESKSLKIEDTDDDDVGQPEEDFFLCKSGIAVEDVEDSDEEEFMTVSTSEKIATPYSWKNQFHDNLTSIIKSSLQLVSDQKRGPKNRKHRFSNKIKIRDIEIKRSLFVDRCQQLSDTITTMNTKMFDEFITTLCMDADLILFGAGITHISDTGPSFKQSIVKNIGEFVLARVREHYTIRRKLLETIKNPRVTLNDIFVCWSTDQIHSPSHCISEKWLLRKVTEFIDNFDMSDDVKIELLGNVRAYTDNYGWNIRDLFSRFVHSKPQYLKDHLQSKSRSEEAPANILLKFFSCLHYNHNLTITDELCSCVFNIKSQCLDLGDFTNEAKKNIIVTIEDSDGEDETVDVL